MRHVLLPVILILFGCTHHNFDEHIGADFLGVRYVASPLGEEIAPDTDPLIRYDAFDCMTFVETVLANGDVNQLNKIRYKNGEPGFINRNHFIETDWLENNSALVENVSNQYAKTSVRKVIIDKKNWFKTVHNIDVDVAPQVANLEYIPYANLRNITVSKPMIVLFIIDNAKIRNKIGTDLAVRHMGFLLPNGTLRHASRKSGKVVDEDFSKYVKQIMENQNNLGIMLLEIKK